MTDLAETGSTLALVENRIQQGRFEGWLSLVAGLSSLLAGLEVSYEHYRGSYSRRIMYTPVILSGALLGAGIWDFRGGRNARMTLRALSAITLADCATGFYFHARGIQRKPGGWRLPITNIIMGPPIFAPLLFGVSAYLGFIASFLRRASDPPTRDLTTWSSQLSHGEYQKHLSVVTILAAFFSGFEAWYSHYKNNFQYGVQWTPLIVAPALMLAAGGAIRSERVGKTWLPAVSAVAMANGAIGFGYHARGVMKRPGGLKKPFYNILYGPPIFAPLLFAAAGFVGLLASLMRRESR